MGENSSVEHSATANRRGVEADYELEIGSADAYPGPAAAAEDRAVFVPKSRPGQLGGCYNTHLEKVHVVDMSAVYHHLGRRDWTGSCGYHCCSVNENTAEERSGCEIDAK